MPEYMKIPTSLISDEIITEYKLENFVDKDGYAYMEIMKRMREYLQKMFKEFPIKFKKDGRTSAAGGVDLFKQDFSKKLDMKQQELFHITVAKLIFISK